MIAACPICGAIGGACHDTPYLAKPPVEVPLETKEVVSMAAVAKEQKGKIRVPAQRVRAGRGTPGYKGDVEVYEVPAGRSAFETQPGVDAADALEGKTRAELDEIATGLGLDAASYGNKGKIIDAIREARDEE